MQVKFINSAIDTAPRSSPLHGLPHVSDPSDGIVEVLIQCMEWNLTTRRRVIPESELPEVQQAAVDRLSRPQRSGWSMLIVSITLLSSGYLQS